MVCSYFPRMPKLALLPIADLHPSQKGVVIGPVQMVNAKIASGQLPSPLVPVTIIKRHGRQIELPLGGLPHGLYPLSSIRGGLTLGKEQTTVCQQEYGGDEDRLFHGRRLLLK
jgi:hypothetical protein